MTSGLDNSANKSLGARPLLQPLWDADINILLWVQERRRWLPLTMRAIAEALTSSHPAYDVSLVVWIAMVPGLWYLGAPFMWQLAVNVVLSFTFSWTVGRVVATPADVDPRIRPRGRLAMSVLLGAATVPALQTLATMLWPRGVPADVHIIGGVALGFAFLSFMAYRAEENGAPFLRIRKRDYIRALREAAKRSTQLSEQAQQRETKEMTTSQLAPAGPQTGSFPTDSQHTTQLLQPVAARVGRDSFFYLLAALQEQRSET